MVLINTAYSRQYCSNTACVKTLSRRPQLENEITDEMNREEEEEVQEEDGEGEEEENGEGEEGEEEDDSEPQEGEMRDWCYTCPV